MTTSEIRSAINLSIILRPITDHLDLDTGKTVALCSIMHKLYIREPHKQGPQEDEWLKTLVGEVMDLMDEPDKAEKVEEACEMKNAPCTDTEEDEELRTTNEKFMNWLLKDAVKTIEKLRKELEELRTEKVRLFNVVKNTEARLDAVFEVRRDTNCRCCRTTSRHLTDMKENMYKYI